MFWVFKKLNSWIFDIQMCTTYPIHTTTRYGRTIRAPKNEYSDRTYVAGSGFVGADHYHQDFIGGRETALGLKLEMAVENSL
jgi:hypothetical protein